MTTGGLLNILSSNMEDVKEVTQKYNKTCDLNADSPCAGTDQRLAGIWMFLQHLRNFVEFQVLMTCYYMPSFHMAYMEFGFLSKNDYRISHIPLTCSNIEQSIIIWFMHTIYFIHVLIKKCLCDVTIKQLFPCDPTIQASSDAFPSKNSIQNSSNQLASGGPTPF